jgi:hypothetical protein
MGEMEYPVAVESVVSSGWDWVAWKIAKATITVAAISHRDLNFKNQRDGALQPLNKAAQHHAKEERSRNRNKSGVRAKVGHRFGITEFFTKYSREVWIRMLFVCW